MFLVWSATGLSIPMCVVCFCLVLQVTSPLELTLLAEKDYFKLLVRVQGSFDMSTCNDAVCLSCSSRLAAVGASLLLNSC